MQRRTPAARNIAESRRLLGELENLLADEDNEIQNPFESDEELESDDEEHRDVETITGRIDDAISDPENTSLNLTYAHLHFLSVEALQLIQRIITQAQIHNLDLAYCNIEALSPNQLACFCEILSNPAIHFIDLSDNDFDKLTQDEYQLICQALFKNPSLLSVDGLPEDIQNAMKTHTERNSMLAEIYNLTEAVLQKYNEQIPQDPVLLDKLIIELEESLDDFKYARNYLLTDNSEACAFHLNALDTLENRINHTLLTLYFTSFERTLMSCPPNAVSEDKRHTFILSLLKCLTLNDRLVTFEHHSRFQRTFDQFLVSYLGRSALEEANLPANQAQRARLLKYLLIKHFKDELLPSSDTQVSFFQPPSNHNNPLAAIDHCWIKFKESIEPDNDLKALIKAIDKLSDEGKLKRARTNERDDDAEPSPSPSKKQRK